MILRFLLISILLTLAVRAAGRLIGGIIDGIGGPPRGAGVPQRGVQMVRDPICGTFILPDRAVSIADGRGRVFFCSETCRDKYRARTA
jgi:YHS domain-containing protein